MRTMQALVARAVGELVMQLGRHLGFKTINVVRRRSAVEELVELGGTEVICTEDQDLVKRVRGFWLYRWFSTTPQEQIGAALERTFELVAGGAVGIPEGQPLPLEQFA